MKRYFLVISVLMVLLASPCFAGITPGGVSGGFEMGWYFYDPQERVDNSNQTAFWVGYDPIKNIGIEGRVAYVGSKTKNELLKARSWLYRLEGLYYFMPDSKFVPYAALGVGARSIRFTDDTKDSDAYMGGDSNDFTVDLGFGVKYFITDYLVARLDVRDVMMPSRYKDEFLNNIEASLGIGFYMSKKPKAVEVIEEPVSAPEPVPPVVAPEPEPVAPVVAPAPVTVIEKQIIEKGRATLDIKFDFAKATIQGMYDKDLRDFAAVMKKNPDLKVYIEGHTDNIGTSTYNKKLSQERADNVKKFLVEKLGVDGSRITAIGYGEDKPIADNKTADGRLKNRRVEAAVNYETIKKAD